MRKSLLAVTLVGSLLAVAVTSVLAGNPAADSIPDVGSIDVPAGSGQAGGSAVTSADADAAVLTDGAPAPAAADGLATAEASGPSILTGNPESDSMPAVETISVPANSTAGDNPPATVPVEVIAPASEPPMTPAATTTTPTGDPTSGGTDAPPSGIVMVVVDSGHGQESVNLSLP